ncbi:uncharacterized protein LOC129618981 [Condylostylus longicornis]|uniref:uncharacterized protein LOC129618981 n=1 Tax=Condylostylus longicornis TaxID=2530218 RepID=UPI00244E402F|nr:uncharacterized protein LOC129618981 [Condylostylus longicornis]
MAEIDGCTREVYSGLVQVTFDCLEPPKEIKVGFLIVPVRKYYMAPMRCSMCQRLGHKYQHCKITTPICGQCNKEKTETTEEHILICSPIKCANCANSPYDDNHPANARDCPSYLREKEAIKIATGCRIPKREAYKKIPKHIPNKTNNNPTTQTMITKDTDTSSNKNNNITKNKTAPKHSSLGIMNNQPTQPTNKNIQPTTSIQTTLSTTHLIKPKTNSQPEHTNQQPTSDIIEILNKHDYTTNTAKSSDISEAPTCTEEKQTKKYATRSGLKNLETSAFAKK